MTTTTTTDGRLLRGLREMGRGLEGQVELGTGSGWSVRLQVTVPPTDPEWQALRAMIDELMVKRAFDAVSTAVQPTLQRRTA